MVKVGKNLYAVGWGGTKKVHKHSTAKKGDLSTKLKQVTIPFLDDKKCAKKVKQMNWYFSNTTQFCAGDKRGKSDTCHGDSGGPAMALHFDPVNKEKRWYQVGIISWGNGCAQKDEYGYYTKVSAFLNWINNKIKGAHYYFVTIQYIV